MADFQDIHDKNIERDEKYGAAGNNFSNSFQTNYSDNFPGLLYENF